MQRLPFGIVIRDVSPLEGIDHDGVERRVRESDEHGFRSFSLGACGDSSCGRFG